MYINGLFEARPRPIGQAWQILTSESWHLADIGLNLPQVHMNAVPKTAQLMAAATNAMRRSAELLDADPLALALMCDSAALAPLIDGARYARSRLGLEATAGRSLPPSQAVLYARLTDILRANHVD